MNINVAKHVYWTGYFTVLEILHIYCCNGYLVPRNLPTLSFLCIEEGVV